MASSETGELLGTIPATEVPTIKDGSVQEEISDAIGDTTSVQGTPVRAALTDIENVKPSINLTPSEKITPPHVDTPRPGAATFDYTRSPSLHRRSLEDNGKVAHRLPSTPCIEEVDTTDGAQLAKTPLQKSEAALLFAMILAASAYLSAFCLVRWFYWSDNGFVVIPLCFIGIGLALDNYRLFRGVLLEETGLSHGLTTLTYLAEFSAIPLLWLTIAEIFSYQTGWWLIPIPARVLAVTFCVNGFNAFLAGPQGHYMVTSDGGVWRHTLDPFKVPFSLIIQPVMVAVAGLFLGFLSLCIYGDSSSFLIQVLAFAGQALAAREPIRGQYITNALEFLYCGSLLYMYMIQI